MISEHLTEQVITYLNEFDKERLRAFARRYETNLSDAVRYMITSALDEEEQKIGCFEEVDYSEKYLM